MIDESLRDVVRFNQWVALQACGNTEEPRSGLYLTAEDGGPTQSHSEFVLTGRDIIAAWQSWKLQRGEQID